MSAVEDGHPLGLEIVIAVSTGLAGVVVVVEWIASKIGGDTDGADGVGLFTGFAGLLGGGEGEPAPDVGEEGLVFSVHFGCCVEFLVLLLGILKELAVDTLLYISCRICMACCQSCLF